MYDFINFIRCFWRELKPHCSLTDKSLSEGFDLSLARINIAVTARKAIYLACLTVISGCAMDAGFDASAARGAKSSDNKKKKDFGVFDFAKECGLNTEKMDDENAVLLQQSLTSLPITVEGTQTGVAYSVTTQAKVNISATAKRATQNVAVSVIDTKAQAPSGGGLIGLIVGAVAPGIVKNKANEQAGENSGTTTSDAMPQKDWLQLVDGDNSEFEGLLCAAQGGKTMTINQGNDTVVVQFSPALINSVSPFAPIERMRKEIGQSRTFKVTANVQGGSAASATGSFSGTTTIREINPKFNCQGTTKNADIAYEFIHNFPGGAHKVGLSKRQVMYFDTTKKKIVAIINEDDKVDPQLKKTLPPVCLVSDN